jgi:hypothetical protein
MNPTALGSGRTDGFILLAFRRQLSAILDAAVAPRESIALTATEDTYPDPMAVLLAKTEGVTRFHKSVVGDLASANQ